jgi:hypothetical protein
VPLSYKAGLLKTSVVLEGRAKTVHWFFAGKQQRLIVRLLIANRFTDEARATKIAA